MKKRVCKRIFSVLLGCALVFLLFQGLALAGQPEYFNWERYLVRTATDGSAIFDTELAEIARRMAGDVYAIKTNNPNPPAATATMRAEEFYGVGSANWVDPVGWLENVLNEYADFHFVTYDLRDPNNPVTINLDPADKLNWPTNLWDIYDIADDLGLIETLVPGGPVISVLRTIDNLLPTSGNFAYGVKTFAADGRSDNHVLSIAVKGSEPLTSDYWVDKTVDWLLTNARFWGDGSGYHTGFSKAAQTIYDRIRVMSVTLETGETITVNEFLNRAAQPDSHYYVMAAGHSLGGAVADILVGNHLNSRTGLSKNVVCYTYAAPLPCSTSRASALNAKNIFNIVNTEDFVPKIGYNIGVNAARIGKDIRYTISETEKNASQQYNYYDSQGTATGSYSYTEAHSHNLDTTYKYIVGRICDNIPAYYSTFYRTTRANQRPLFSLNTSYTATGNRTFTGDFTSTQRVTFNGGQMTVNGNCNFNDTFTMQNDADYLLVTGDFAVYGHTGNSNNYQTAGTVELKGNFSQLYPNGYYSYYATGTHKTIFSGTGIQEISFKMTSINRFNLLEITNPSPRGLVFTTSVTVASLFNHNRNKFTLTKGGSFVDYDKDGLLDHLDAYPLDAAKKSWPGDVNGNGKIDGTDLTAAQNHLLNKSPLTAADALQAADLSADGKVDILDLLLLKQRLSAAS